MVSPAFALLALVAPAGPIFDVGSHTTWKYLDAGVPPAGPSWTGADFDDSTWPAGAAPLGHGDPGITTDCGRGPGAARKPVTVWFRRSFDAPELRSGEAAVLSLCADDGAIVYLNGEEIGRVNLPAGPVRTETLALRALSDADEGFYRRWPVPAGRLRPGRNVIAAEVHQCSPSSSDLFFDLALLAVPPGTPAPIRASARPVVEAYREAHYLGPGTAIPDGYEDGGRQMELDAAGQPSSRREILAVDRTADPVLARHLAFARSAELRALPPLDRARRIGDYICRVTTPPGGDRWDEATCEQLRREFAGRSILIGEWIAQGHAGMCRHRSLLFKLMADEAGLRAALVRGNLAQAGAHAWNELQLDDGRRLLVDLMARRDGRDFPDVGSPPVAGRYLTVAQQPWYAPSPAAAPP